MSHSRIERHFPHQSPPIAESVFAQNFVIRRQMTRLLCFIAGNYPHLRQSPRDAMPELRFAVKGFFVKPILHRIHRVMIDKTKRVGIGTSIICQPVAGDRRICRFQGKIRIRIRFGRIRRVELLGKPRPQTETANSVIESRSRSESRLFQKPFPVARPAIADDIFFIGILFCNGKIIFRRNRCRNCAVVVFDRAARRAQTETNAIALQTAPRYA